MKQSYFYIGNKIHGGNKIGLIFVLKIANKSLLKLSRLIYISKNNSLLVVFTSLSRSEKGVFKKHLKANEAVRKYFDAEACRLLEPYYFRAIETRNRSRSRYQTTHERPRERL